MILQPYLTGSLLVGFGGFSAQPQQPQHSGFGTSQPQNTFGGEAHTIGLLSKIHYNDKVHYQDLAELARFQNPQRPLAGLVRRQISLPKQASGVLGQPLNLLGLLALVRLLGLVLPTLGLLALVGQQVVAGEMQVLHKQQLGLEVCSLSIRDMSKLLIEPFSRINWDRSRNRQSSLPSVH